MLFSREYGPDVRIEKEAHTLALAGFRVTVVAWDRTGRFPLHAVHSAPSALSSALKSWPRRVPDASGDITVYHLPIAAGYRTGKKLLRRMPQFWWRAWCELRRLRPDIVHANDLDTLPVAYAYGRMAGVPVLYDAREYYPGMVRGTVGEQLSRLLDRLDGWLAPRVDGIVTVGERLADRFRRLGGRVWIVHNSHPLPDLDVLARQGDALRQRLGVPQDALVVGYVGHLTPDRLLEPLLGAVAHIPGAYAVVGGEGPLYPDVRRAAERCPRIIPLGWVALGDVPSVVSASDVVYYGLNPLDPNGMYFMPNLAFFAMGAGKPILTTPVGEIADLVAERQCGVVMAAPTEDAARASLAELLEPAHRAALGARSRAIGMETYHWGHAATELLSAYDWVRNVRNCS